MPQLTPASDGQKLGLRAGSDDTGGRLLRRWLQQDRALFVRILVLAVGLGLFSLTVPVLAQAVIGAVTASVLLPPVFVLGICLLLCLAYVALLYVLEIRAVEWLARHVFLRITHDLGARLLAHTSSADQPIWAHRFFEVVSVEKSSSTIVMKGLSALLTLALGALFLFFYDPLFGILALLVAALFVAAIGGSYRQGRGTAVKESSTKYAVGKVLAGFEAVDPRAAAASSEKLVAEYGRTVHAWHAARADHFKIVLRQSRYLLALSALSLASVVVLGGSLVALGELTLGQLVAAELVITGMAQALNKLTQVLPKIYDLYASLAKLAAVPGEVCRELPSSTWSEVAQATKREGRHAKRWAMAVVLAPIVLVLPWQQTVHGSGNVVAFDPTSREQAIDATVKGRIKTWHVMEGTAVSVGDPLVELEDIDARYAERLDSNRAAMASKLEAAKLQRDAYVTKQEAYKDVQQQAMLAAKRKIEGAVQKKLAQEKKRDAILAKKRAAKLNLERMQTLSAEGIASMRKRELAVAKFAELESEERALQAKILEAEAEIAVQRAERTKIAADMAVKIATASAEIQKSTSDVASATESLTKIEVAVARQAQQIVRAPVAGTVQWVRGHQGGAVVKEGERLLLIVPEVDQLAIEQFYDGNDVPLLRVGDEVRVQFEGWPALVLAGVPGGQPGTFAGRIAVIDPKTRKNGMVRVLVVPDGDAVWPPTSRLRQGMRAQGWAVLDRVSIGYELWRRVNGFPILPDLHDVSSGDATGSKSGVSKALP